MLKKFWNWLTSDAYAIGLEDENASLWRRVEDLGRHLDWMTKARNHFELKYAQEQQMVNFWFNATQQGVDTAYREFVRSMFVKAEGPDGFMHAAAGMAGEAGEVLEIAKKHWVSGKVIDRAHLIEELGDSLFYWVAATLNQGIDPMEAVDGNVRKLNARYPAGTSALQPHTIIDGVAYRPTTDADGFVDDGMVPVLFSHEAA